jgi:hypothetical protein
MKTNSLFWALCWVAVGSVATMQGCGGDDDDDGDDDGSMTGGSSGSNTGGSSTGGRAGSSTGGRAGSSTGGSTTGGGGGAPGGMGGEGGNAVGGEGGGSGGGDRASACTDYCSTYFDTGCPMYDGGFYGTQAGCQTLCETSVWALGEPGDMAGNSVHCRLSHAELAAAASDPTTHCGHAKADPTGICVP